MKSVFLVILCFFACQRAPKDVPRTPTAAENRPQLETPAQSRQDPIQIISPFSEILPVRLEALALFQAEDMRAAASHLFLVFPLRLSSSQDVQRYLSKFFGPAWSALGPWCAVALLEMGGWVMACQGFPASEILSPPPDKPAWQAWNFKGFSWPDQNIVAASGAGFLLLGSTPAVEKVAMVQSGAWPALRPVLDAVSKDITRLGLFGSGDSAGLWFFRPALAPWCIVGICEGTAAFAGPSGLRIFVVSGPGLDVAAKTLLDNYWQNLRKIVENQPLPEPTLKPISLLFERYETEVRGSSITLKTGPGSALVLVAALLQDRVRALFAPSESF